MEHLPEINTKTNLEDLIRIQGKEAVRAALCRVDEADSEDPWVMGPEGGLRQINGVQVVVPGHPELKVYKYGSPDIDFKWWQEGIDRRRIELGLDPAPDSLLE
jgi:hypothetical protein